MVPLERLEELTRLVGETASAHLRIGRMLKERFKVDPATCTVECPRHGSLFDLSTGRPKTLPAFAPVQTFPIAVEDDTITLEVT